MSADTSILDQIISHQGLSHLDKFHPQETLNSLLDLLNDREREVVVRRFGLRGQEPETLEKIGGSFQITRERIRQIERLAIKKLTTDKQALVLIQPIRQVVMDCLEKDGGASARDNFINQLVKLSSQVKPQVIGFYLDELLNDVALPLGGAGTRFTIGYRFRAAVIDYLNELHEAAENWIEEKSSPVSESELIYAILNKSLKSPLGLPLTAEVLPDLLLLSDRLKRNAYGAWGLKDWETITPRRMNDKIYLVLKQAGKPLHFREITRLVNETKFDKKSAFAPTVHNELIMDDKYVLVGRGIYALREWGYQPGVVADVVVKILQGGGVPLTREQIVQAVMKVRQVKPATVHLALANKEIFESDDSGRYSLKNTTI
ncbi:MAG: sigma factor-like helix-turn-helix DNA-binding protein [Patescibacteria group bacterium]